MRSLRGVKSINNLIIKKRTSLKSHLQRNSLSSSLLRFQKNRKYVTERQLLNGTSISRSDHKSIIHFSFNKAATQYVKSILSDFALEANMDMVSINEYAFNSDLPYMDSLTEDGFKDYAHIFKTKGYIYSAFGGLFPALNMLTNFKVILMSRDPRDILVSNYYSLVYSHPVPYGSKKSSFLDNRAAAKNQSIDEFVLQNAGDLLKKFESYLPLIKNESNNLHITQYEVMVTDFKRWLNDLINYCEIEISSELFDKIVLNNQASLPSQENIDQHVRKGIAGDYKNKLNPGTIDELDSIFRNVLMTYGYK